MIMSKPLKIEKCNCGKKVTIRAASGGTRYEKTMYSVDCPSCGTVVEDCIPSNCSGRMADAIREWNRERRAGFLEWQASLSRSK